MARKKLGSATLLDLGDSDSDDEQQRKSGFKINENYAQRYDTWRFKEEAQKAKDRYGADVLDKNEGSSSSSESDEDIEWDLQKDKDFFKTLSSLKKKDPKIYDSNVRFFHEKSEDNEKPGPSSKVAKEDKKPYLLKDHQREMVLKKVAKGSDDEGESEDDVVREPKNSILSYQQELQQIKKSFKDVHKDGMDEDEEDDGLLQLKKKTTEELEEEDADYRRWLKGQLTDLGEKGEEKDLKGLKEYWTDPNLDEGEKFLRDFILNRGYAEVKRPKTVPSYEEVVNDADDNLEEDNKFETERETFEHKYNFRFEEPDQEFIKRYPRTVKDSLRREDDRRKKQREAVKERKDEKKERKRDEIQRLKAHKRKEIEEKLKQLQAISGTESIEDVDIDGDFDPEEYDARMQKIFNNTYYDGENDDEKPIFPHDPDIDSDEDPWGAWVPPRERIEDVIKTEPLSESDTEEVKEIGLVPSKKDSKKQTVKTDVKQEVIDELIEGSKGRSKKKKSSMFLSALEKDKPTFDPKVHKSFKQYFDEYYSLNFEDMLGDMPCRFKYRKVVPNSFGLSMEEILKAPDKELNRWASVKKTCQYREETEEKYEVQAYVKKASDERKKKRVLMSLYASPDSDNEAEVEAEEATEEPKEKKKRKRNKKGKSPHHGKQSDETVVDDNRLLSYGLNPTKFKKRLKYGQGKNKNK